MMRIIYATYSLLRRPRITKLAGSLLIVYGVIGLADIISIYLLGDSSTDIGIIGILWINAFGYIGTWIATLSHLWIVWLIAGLAMKLGKMKLI